MDPEPLSAALGETLALFEESGVPRTTPEVAECLGLGRRTAYARLERLVERDRLETKKVGANARVWYRRRADDGAAAPDPPAAASLVDGVFDDIEVGIVVLDEHFDVAWINATAERYFGLDREAVLGRDKRRLVDERIAPVVEDAGRFSETVLATYDRNTYAERFECHVTGSDGREERWLEHRSKPIESGAYAGGRVELYFDVTDRKRSERARRDEREEFESLVGAVDEYAIFTLDAEGYVRTWNPGAERIKGYAADEVVGEHFSVFYSADDRAAGVPGENLAEATRHGSVEDEGWRIREDGSAFWANVTISAIRDDDGDLRGFAKITRDMTERREYERRLERQRDELRAELDDVFARIDDGFFALDEELRFVHVNERAARILDRSVEALLDEYVRDAFDLGVGTAGAFEEALETQESISFEEYYDPLGRWFDVHVYPSETGLSVYFRDITGRKRYEARLRSLYDSSRELLRVDTPHAIGETLVGTARDTLDLPGVVVYRHDAERDRLVPETASVEASFMREEFPAVPVGDGSITGRVFADGDPRYYENVLDSPHLQVPPDATEMRAGLFIPLGDAGILVAGSREVDGLDADTRRLVELLATNATAAYERVARERELIRQREQLAAANSLNRVVRDVTDAVIEQSTREEIEEAVCERLADSDSYRFAWIGDADATTRTVTLRTEAGVEGYLDGITISVDPDDERSEGPTGRAFRTGAVQTVHDSDSDARHDPWRDHVERYDFRSSAAIPITNGETVYGVLNVYAGRPNAFEGEEREMVAQLGEIVGHAVAAVERKQALMSDEVVELQFQIEDVFASLGVEDDTSDPIRLEHAVAIGDGDYLVFGRTTPAAVEAVARMVEVVPFYEDVTVRDDGDGARFELRVSEPPVLSVVASLGGSVEDALIEDRDYRLTVHLSPSADVGRLIDAVMDTYPDATLLKRRQLTTPRRVGDPGANAITPALTDRQRTVLETAYHAGFFAWPRDASGEEVAASIGVAPPTFHQHLRKAERKVLDSVFSAPMRRTG